MKLRTGALSAGTPRDTVLDAATAGRDPDPGEVATTRAAPARESAAPARANAARPAAARAPQTARPRQGLGNQAALRMRAAASSIAVSRPGDALEREADRVAEAVVTQLPVAATPRISPAHGEIQRTCAACSTSGGTCPTCEERTVVQRHARGAGEPARDLDASRVFPGGAGAALAPEARAFFEERFGADLGDVRVHTDVAADRAAHALGAVAYTVGSDIVFGAGAYDPTTHGGQRLLAHELTHVLQNARGGVASPRTSTSGDAAEHEAAANERALGGRAPLAAIAAPVAVARQVRPTDPLPHFQSGDRLRVVVRNETGDYIGGPDGFVLDVDASGVVQFAAVGARVPIAGLDARTAETHIGNELTRVARVALFAWVTPLRIAGHDLAPPGADPVAATEAAQATARANFRAFIAPIHEPADAVARYDQWVIDHAGTDEFVNTSPSEVWRIATARPASTRDPQAEAVQFWLRFATEHQDENRHLEGEAGRRASEAMLHFMDWFSAHQDSPLLQTVNPGDVYGRLVARATIASIDREVAREATRARQAREDAAMEDPARTAHFDEFFRVARQLWGESSRRFPYVIPIPSEGRDILVTGDPVRQIVLDAMARELMDWAGQHMFDTDFLTVAPSTVLRRLLRERYAAALDAAAQMPLQHESIDRHEILWGRVLSTFGQAVGYGLLAVAVVGIAVGLGIPGLLVGGFLAGVAALSGVRAYAARRAEVESTPYQVPVAASVLAAVGDVVGVSQVIEGITGERLGTGERLSSVDRSDSLGAGAGNVVTLVFGSRAFRFGRGLGEALPARTPPPSGGAPPPVRVAPPRGGAPVTETPPPPAPRRLYAVPDPPAPAGPGPAPARSVVTPIRPGAAAPGPAATGPRPAVSVPRSGPMPQPGDTSAYAYDPAVEVQPSQPRPQLRVVPRVEPAPVEVAPPEPAPAAEPSADAVRAAAPGSSTSTTPGQSPSPGVVPVPALQPQPQPQSGCPTNTHPIHWPTPSWIALGINDTGALSPQYNRPPQQVITKQASIPRDRTLVDEYNAIPANVAARARAATLGYSPPQVHHKWPLFLGGPDIIENFVFLPDSHTGSPHYNWHLALYSQHPTIRGRENLGTQYCVL